MQKDKIRTADLFSQVPQYLRPLFDACEYPWEIVRGICDFVKGIIRDGCDGYTELYHGVIVAHDAKIYDCVTIEPPAVIGHGVVLRPGAFIRGSVIVSDGCTVGNSTELKNCILLERCEVPHYNYVGDSLLGYHAHLGAGAVCSNLKNDKSNVVIRGSVSYDTGMRKLGAILGDGVNVGCGCVLNPGCIIGPNTAVYPNLTLRGVYPENSIVKSNENTVPADR